MSTDLGGDAILHRGDIGHHSAGVGLELVQDDARGDVRRRGDHDDAWLDVAVDAYTSGPHIARQSE
jgi:hypothetical protein